MFSFKNCATKRNRALALVLLGASFAIQMVPPILHNWANVTGVSDEVAMAAIIAIYLSLLAFVMFKGRSAKS